jgi:hypothetical protein
VFAPEQKESQHLFHFNTCRYITVAELTPRVMPMLRKLQLPYNSAGVVTVGFAVSADPVGQGGG